MTPVVTIIICTRNRAADLEKTLASFASLCVPSDLPAELLIVDNGSTDATPEVARRCRLPDIPVRYIPEPRPGQCHARNTGLAAARGQIILFTDDDVRVPPNWIEGMCRPIASGEGDAVAGGVVFPTELERRIPCRAGWFASTSEIPVHSPDRFVGANMAFHRRILSHVPAFDTELGPGALGFGDETLFAMQTIQAGFRLVSRFEVAVEHHFGPTRLTRASMLDTAWRIGRSHAYIAYHWRHVSATWSKLHDAKCWAGLLGRRLIYSPKCFVLQRPEEWELKRVEAAGYRSQLVREEGRARNYERFGLVKRNPDTINALSSMKHALPSQVSRKAVGQAGDCDGTLDAEQKLAKVL